MDVTPLEAEGFAQDLQLLSTTEISELAQTPEADFFVSLSRV